MRAKRRKLGRPAKTRHCNVRMTRGTQAMLRDRAKEYGMTQGALLERALSRYVDARDQVDV